MKKVAVIGYGGMGKWHCSHILKSDTVTLTGISDIDPMERELARERDALGSQSCSGFYSGGVMGVHLS